MRKRANCGIAPALPKVLVGAFLASLATVGPAWAQQSPPLLEITSPTGGTVVTPGQTISVTVTSPASVSFQLVGFSAQNPLPSASSLATAVPAQFSLTVPANTQPGKYMLTADGVTASGQDAHSDTILIDVERADLPTALRTVMPGTLALDVLGEEFPEKLLATFSDGSVLDVTNSTYVTFSSSNTSIATVSSTGMVTAGVAGSATITATYTLNGQSVQLAIPVTVLPPVMLVSPPSLDFGGLDVGTASAAQTLTVTNQTHGPMTILQVSATGDFSETDNCVSTSPLQADGGTCTVNVTFTPGAAGARTGSVSIMNKTTAAVTTVPATGSGLGQATTMTTVASSANPAVFGQSVTLTASATSSSSGVPTGAVTFSDGATALATETLAGAQATFASSIFSVGSHSITAAYSGDSTFQPSSGALTETVNPASTTITLMSTANPVILNGAVTLTATVGIVSPGAGSPTGTVTFTDGSTAMATVSLNASDQATFSSSSLSAGAHSIHRAVQPPSIRRV